MTPDDEPPPLFKAVTSSARQLFSLLKCCGFQSKAHVQISQEGLRFTVEESRVMQGHAFVDKNLFTSYNLSLPKRAGKDVVDLSTGASAGDSDDLEDQDHTVSFAISLAALLECLQIFGADTYREKWQSNSGGSNFAGGTSTAMSRSGPGTVFDQQVLRIGGTCCISYHAQGHPLYLTLEENGVVTTCELITYEPETMEDIPLGRDALALKIIMKAGWLYDAIQELEGSSVERLIVAASPQHPYFSLSASGSMGSTVVEFSNDRSLLESFQVPQSIQHTYKFTLINCATRAMAITSKVSIRGDNAGVLSMQFMIEHEGGNPSFIDFRFLPFTSDVSDEES